MLPDEEREDSYEIEQIALRACVDGMLAARDKDGVEWSRETS